MGRYFAYTAQRQSDAPKDHTKDGGCKNSPPTRPVWKRRNTRNQLQKKVPCTKSPALDPPHPPETLPGRSMKWSSCGAFKTPPGAGDARSRRWELLVATLCECLDHDPKGVLLSWDSIYHHEAVQSRFGSGPATLGYFAWWQIVGPKPLSARLGAATPLVIAKAHPQGTGEPPPTGLLDDRGWTSIGPDSTRWSDKSTLRT